MFGDVLEPFFDSIGQEPINRRRFKSEVQQCGIDGTAECALIGSAGVII